VVYPCGPPFREVAVYNLDINMLPRIYMPTGYVANRLCKDIMVRHPQTTGND
jgi:hypothetical protein